MLHIEVDAQRCCPTFNDYDYFNRNFAESSSSRQSGQTIFPSKNFHLKLFKLKGALFRLANCMFAKLVSDPDRSVLNENFSSQKVDSLETVDRHIRIVRSFLMNNFVKAYFCNFPQ